MIRVRPADSRGRTNLGWLDSWHSFSFGEYYDPANSGFRSLRVINDDRVAPGAGFPTHPHRDMEILTYVLDGALEHKDSIGGGSVIRAGDAQRMTAGTGIRHSEFNPSPNETVHLLQIWLFPEQRGLTPSYDQRTFSADEKRNRWRLIASRDGRADSLQIRQDADIYATQLEPGQQASHSLAAGRHAWVQVARGAATLNGQPLKQGDGVAVSEESELSLIGSDQAEVLLFDLA